MKKNRNTYASNRLSNLLDKINFVRKINIQLRLILSFAILCVLPLIFISILAYNKSNSAIEAKINIYSTQIINQVCTNLNIKNTSISDSLGEIINNPEVTNIVPNYDGYTDTEKQAGAKLINNLFKSKFQTKTSIIYQEFMKKVPSTFTFSLGSIFQTDEKILDLPIKFLLDNKASHPENNYVFNAMPIPGIGIKSENGIFVGSVFNDLMNKDNTSVIGIFIKESDYAKLYSNVDLGKDADLFIVDSTGNVVSSRNPEKITVAKRFSEPSLIKNITQGIKDKKSYFNLNMGKEKHLVTYSPISGTDWYMVLTVPYSYVTSDSTALGVSIGLIALIIAVFALLISFIITLSITNPLHKLGFVMAESEKGNLCVQVNDSGNDEISVLSNKFNLMIKSINTLVKDVGTSSVHVLNDAVKVSELSTNLMQASEEISVTTQEVAKGATNQAEDSIDCSNQMNVLSSSINLVDDNMKSISDVVNNASKLSFDVREIMDQLNTKTLISKQASAKITDDINNLNNEMKKIKSIVKSIVGLTQQTNLLSLNASIEAARAGESGKGFAVVANEVKKLANQSREASTSISTIISSIQVATNETVSVASNADIIFKEQMDCVVQADHKINIILGFMSDITNKIYIMGTSVNDISSTKKKTMVSIENISAVSEQSAAIVQEIAASTEEQMQNSKQLMSLASGLNDMTKELAKSISNFKV